MQFFNDKEHIMDYAYSLGYIAFAILIFFIGKVIFELINPKIKVKEELVIKDNLAFSFAITGYFIGLIIVIGSSIVGPSRGFLYDLQDIAVYSTLGIVLLNLTIWFNNKVIMTKFDIKKEIIEDQNVGTGIIEATVFISTALILFGAITGESNGYISGIGTAIGYWLIGMIIMIITSKIYTVMVDYDVHAEIEKDNVAAGVSFSGAILAISIIVMNALLGDFKDWETTLIDVLLQTVLGLLILPIMRIITDKILLLGQKLTDEIVNQENPNIGAAVLEAFSYIGSAILITWSL